ncbi:MAG: hypothetical protein PQJ50_16385 [Spirochaetales bacterium]|nr:hypothetical protein [Spirochaetales bacterium]
MNYKKKITLLALLALLSIPAWAERPSFHSVTLFGLEPYNIYQRESSDGEKSRYFMTAGMSLVQEFYISPNDLLSFGAGVRYMFERSIDEFSVVSSGEKLTFIPIYGVLKINLPVDNVPLYAKLAAGYNFVQGNPAFNDGKTGVWGGFYYSVGGGVDYPFYYSEKTRLSFIFDMGWSSNTVNWENDSSRRREHYMSLDLLAGLGVRF